MSTPGNDSLRSGSTVGCPITGGCSGKNRGHSLAGKACQWNWELLPTLPSGLPGVNPSLAAALVSPTLFPHSRGVSMCSEAQLGSPSPRFSRGQGQYNALCAIPRLSRPQARHPSPAGARGRAVDLLIPYISAFWTQFCKHGDAFNLLCLPSRLRWLRLQRN